MPTEDTETGDNHSQLNYQLLFPLGQDKSVTRNAIVNAYESMKAKRLSDFKKWKEQVSPATSISNGPMLIQMLVLIGDRRN